MTSTLKFNHFIALIRRTIRIFLLAKVKDLKNVLKTVQRVEHATQFSNKTMENIISRKNYRRRMDIYVRSFK